MIQRSGTEICISVWKTDRTEIRRQDVDIVDYIAIDLKSFYASVECAERGLDSLTANLVVADPTRTEKTICLAVSPSLKAYGIPGRCRLFEVNQRLREIRAETGQQIDYIIAPPRMQLYMEYSARIYEIYLKYISWEDIHVYSVDEVFMDVTDYLQLYRKPDGSRMSARDLAVMMIHDVLNQTGITATAGIGTNLYLAKIAMDIVAKHMDADQEGVRIAELDELSYRQQLWDYRPLTAFWRVGRGIARRLEEHGMHTMGDVARMSLQKNYRNRDSWKADYPVKPGAVSGEEFLFQLFGIDAELLIDHAWGIEPVTMEDIRNYKPESNSIGTGQILACGYRKEQGELVVKEMVDSLVLELVEKGLVTDAVVLDVVYDAKQLPSDTPLTHMDHYGRKTIKPSHGICRLENHSSSTEVLTKAALEVYGRITDIRYRIHRLYITFLHVIPEEKADVFFQYDLFTDPAELEKKRQRQEREKKLQHAMLDIKGRYGKNAILKGMNLQKDATAMERNQQIGGHKA